LCIGIVIKLIELNFKLKFLLIQFVLILSAIAVTQNNITSIYYSQDRLNEALKYYEETLKIDDQLRNFKGKASRPWWIGAIYDKQNNPGIWNKH
jgi:tetratricopeptide (TPR) repeat protein